MPSSFGKLQIICDKDTQLAELDLVVGHSVPRFMHFLKRKFNSSVSFSDAGSGYTDVRKVTISDLVWAFKVKESSKRTKILVEVANFTEELPEWLKQLLEEYKTDLKDWPGNRKFKVVFIYR